MRARDIHSAGFGGQTGSGAGNAAGVNLLTTIEKGTGSADGAGRGDGSGDGQPYDKSEENILIP